MSEVVLDVLDREIYDHNVKQINVDLITPNSIQFRKIFEGIEELADNIKDKGIIQPIIVKRSGERFVIVSGERRWRAAKIAGLKKIPCLVLNNDINYTDEISFIENVQRKTLKKIEEYMAIRDFALRGKKHQEILNMIGKRNSSYISKCIKVADFVDMACSSGFANYNELASLIENRTLETLYEIALLSDEDMQLAIESLREIADKDMGSKAGREYIDTLRNKINKVSKIETYDSNDTFIQNEVIAETDKFDKFIQTDETETDENNENQEKISVLVDFDKNNGDFTSSINIDDLNDSNDLDITNVIEDVSVKYDKNEWSTRVIKHMIKDLNIIFDKFDKVQEAKIIISNNKHKKEIIKLIDEAVSQIPQLKFNIEFLKEKIKES